jgi:hypothetical protein
MPTIHRVESEIEHDESPLHRLPFDKECQDSAGLVQFLD